jgi:hypothetical protein
MSPVVGNFFVRSRRRPSRKPWRRIIKNSVQVRPPQDPAVTRPHSEAGSSSHAFADTSDSPAQQAVLIPASNSHFGEEHDLEGV